MLALVRERDPCKEREKLCLRSFEERVVTSLSWDLGPVSRTFRELFGPEKPVVKLKSTFFKNLVFLHVFNVRKDKRIAQFDGLEEPRRCEDVKGIMTPKIDLKSFGTFEGRAPDQSTLTCFWVDWIWLVTHDGKVSSLSLSAASAVICEPSWHANQRGNSAKGKNMYQWKRWAGDCDRGCKRASWWDERWRKKP